MLEYKNYIIHVTFNEEAEIFHAEVIHTCDLITFQGGGSVTELKRAYEFKLVG